MDTYNKIILYQFPTSQDSLKLQQDKIPQNKFLKKQGNYDVVISVTYQDNDWFL